MGVVLFFPDGVAGAVQHLGSILRLPRPAPAPSPVSAPPCQSIGENELNAPPLERAVLGPSRAHGSDTTA
jgi:hypothetical protein